MGSLTRNGRGVTLALILCAALAMGVLWLFIDSNRFHVARNPSITSSVSQSQPAPPAPKK
jgi:hypothetical protein